MGQSTRKSDWRQVSFRLPNDLFEDLAAAARHRGVDLSALLNTLIAAHRPGLVRERAEYDRAMAEAAAAGAGSNDPAERVRELRDVLARLQDEYAAASERLLAAPREAA